MTPSEQFEFVSAIASKLKGRLPPTVEFEELRSVGFLAITKAAGIANRYHRSYRSYMYQRAKGAMLDELRRDPRWSRTKGRLYNHVEMDKPLGNFQGFEKVETFGQTLPDPGPMPGDGIRLKDIRRAICKAKAHLPRREKRMLELKLAGYQQTEIARMEGRTPQAIYERLVKAYNLIRPVVSVYIN